MGQIAIIYFLYSLCAIVAGQNDTKINEFTKTMWLSELFSRAQMEFQISPLASDHCQRDYAYYRSHLRNQSTWAVRMLESSEWPTVGLFSGMTYHFGNFDECLRASSKDVHGQYCLASATYVENSDTNVIHEASVHPDESLSVWEVLKIYKLSPARIDRQNLHWSLCIPHTCSPDDLKISLNSTLDPIFAMNGMHIKVDVDSRFCTVKRKPIEPSSGYRYTMLFFGFILFLIVSTTVYDIVIKTEKKQEQRTVIELLRAFSLAKNLSKLNKITPNEHSAIHFAKILYLLIIIYGHRYIFFVGYPTFNSELSEQIFLEFNMELIHTNVVDVFFMISGFLTFHFGIVPMMKGGCIYLVLSIVLRWIRMVPVFVILMLFIIYILPYTSDGPLWHFRIWNEVNKCKSSWWTNLLAINNFVKTKDQCLVVSWYISTDIHLAIMGGILLFIISKNEKIGIFLSSFVFVLCAAITFIVTYVNNYDGLLKLYMSMLEEPRNSEQFNILYIATYSRAGPYLLGFASAYLAKTLRERGFKFTQTQVVTGLVITIMIGECVQIYGYQFYKFGRAYNRIENGIFSAFNRTLYTLPVAWGFCMYFTSGLGFLDKIFVRDIYVPFGRLTYSVFLVNTVIQLFHASSQKSVMPSSAKMNLVWWAVSDVVFSYIMGLCLHLFAEAPVTNLSKILQKMLMKSMSTPDRSKLNAYQNKGFVSNEVPEVSELSQVYRNSVPKQDQKQITA